MTTIMKVLNGGNVHDFIGSQSVEIHGLTMKIADKKTYIDCYEFTDHFFNYTIRLNITVRVQLAPSYMKSVLYDTHPVVLSDICFAFFLCLL